jgi:hypothetical protein
MDISPLDEIISRILSYFTLTRYVSATGAVPTPDQYRSSFRLQRCMDAATKRASLRQAANGILDSAGTTRVNDHVPPRNDSVRGGTLAPVFFRVDCLNSVASIHASVFDHGWSTAHESQ